MRLAFLLLAISMLVMPMSVMAAPPGVRPVPALCGPAIAETEDAMRLPPHLLEAIARVESGRPDPSSGRLQPWPWTINADGQGAFYATKADAIAAVRALQANGVRSIDVGCMQINLMYHPTAFSSLDQAFDPWANARYAARFLETLYTADNDWLRAIGDYHSQTASLGADYRRRVLALWRDPAANWSLGLAVAYRDFEPRSKAYDDFVPNTTVYGAFAGAFNPLPLSARR